MDDLTSQLPAIVTAADHDEIWGVDLRDPTSTPAKVVLQKYLKANSGDSTKAATQLKETLIWRKEFNPRSAATESFPGLEKLGYITSIDKWVVVWNVYGAADGETFKDLNRFLRWRIGLMERSLLPLDLSHATVPITDTDPYQCVQVHDYLNVSFLRMDPLAKAASKATIALMTAHYPELLSRKLFVNVPVVMGWMFAAMKLVLSKETVAKFIVLSYGDQLAQYLGKGIPIIYGGEGPALEVRQVKEVSTPIANSTTEPTKESLP